MDHMVVEKYLDAINLVYFNYIYATPDLIKYMYNIPVENTMLDHLQSK